MAVLELEKSYKWMETFSPESAVAWTMQNLGDADTWSEDHVRSIIGHCIESIITWKGHDDYEKVKAIGQDSLNGNRDYQSTAWMMFRLMLAELNPEEDR